jgi:hypothetical protein
MANFLVGQPRELCVTINEIPAKAGQRVLVERREGLEVE